MEVSGISNIGLNKYINMPFTALSPINARKSSKYVSDVILSFNHSDTFPTKSNAP
jgi:hypothetical protein